MKKCEGVSMMLDSMETEAGAENGPRFFKAFEPRQGASISVIEILVNPHPHLRLSSQFPILIPFFFLLVILSPVTATTLTAKMRDERTTLLRPPEPDKTKAPIENVLEVTEMGVMGPDIFTNTRQPWLPPGARGIYGGAVIAQCLASAQKTVPDDFLPHSCHCYFLLAGSSSIPILFHVERVRDGRSFATRTVQARQRGKCIFTTTISFAKHGSADDGKKKVRHAAPPPGGAVEGAPPEDWDGEGLGSRTGPIQNYQLEVLRATDPTSQPHERKCRTWQRARGRISDAGGHEAHLNALAYMSDSLFIGTVSRIHGLWRLPVAPSQVPDLPTAQRELVTGLLEREGMGSTIEEWESRPTLGMLVSLDHSIYFHEPKRVRADEWMFAEMESPWAGQERGVVMQRIFARDGTLLASCVQEVSFFLSFFFFFTVSPLVLNVFKERWLTFDIQGVIRLKQDEGQKSSKL